MLGQGNLQICCFEFEDSSKKILMELKNVP